MNKRVGANTRKKHAEKKQRIGNVAKKAIDKGSSVFRVVFVTVIIVGGVAFGATRVISWMKASPLFVVKNITIEGCLRVSKDDILKVSKLKTGIRILGVNPSLAKAKIEAMPWIKSAKVERHFPGTVAVKIIERKPFVLVCFGKVYYADEDGVLLPLFEGTYSNLPVVTGLKDVRLDSVKCVSQESMNRLKQFFTKASSFDKLFVKHVSQIDLSDDPIIRLRFEDVPYMVEMTDEQPETTLRRLRQIVESGQHLAGNVPSVINLCYENLAYVR